MHIRPGGPEDIAACAAIWLEASLAGHGFIPAAFWRENRRAMEETYLPQAGLLIAEEGGQLVGFSAVCGETLAALFVLPALWGRGVGKALLLRAREGRSRLELAVYCKNARAVSFYTATGFVPGEERLCPHTGERERVMVWTKPD